MYKRVATWYSDNMKNVWYGLPIEFCGQLVWRVQIEYPFANAGSIIMGVFSMEEAENIMISMNYNGTKPTGLKIKKHVKF